MRVPVAALAGALLLAGPAVSAVSAEAVAHSCHGRAATIVGTPGDDVLRGTPHADVIAGRAGDDLVPRVAAATTSSAGERVRTR